MKKNALLAFVTTIAAGITACSSLSGGSGWTVLFNGQTPTQLRGYKQPAFPADRWVIDGDALKTVPGQAVDLITVEKYENFEVELEWKVAAATIRMAALMNSAKESAMVESRNA